MFTCDINKECVLASRADHPENTIIKIGSAVFGNGSFVSIAGPCAIESEQQLFSVAGAVKRSGASILRAGAFKPRSSPYSFQGMGRKGLELLSKLRSELSIPVVSEITDASELSLFDDVDLIQVGARNMQNYELLKALGSAGKPVLLKRGVSATYAELLLSAEYIMANGNPNVILCERGIRSFGNYTRYTPDVAAIPSLKALTHLPVIADPSHSTGRSELVSPICLAYAAAGADGAMIEVHDDPAASLCDGVQAITPDEYDKLCKKITIIRSSL